MSRTIVREQLSSLEDGQQIERTREELGRKRKQKNHANMHGVGNKHLLDLWIGWMDGWTDGLPYLFSHCDTWTFQMLLSSPSPSPPNPHAPRSGAPVPSFLSRSLFPWLTHLLRRTYFLHMYPILSYPLLFHLSQCSVSVCGRCGSVCLLYS